MNQPVIKRTPGQGRDRRNEELNVINLINRETIVTNYCKMILPAAARPRNRSISMWIESFMVAPSWVVGSNVVVSPASAMVFEFLYYFET